MDVFRSISTNWRIGMLPIMVMLII